MIRVEELSNGVMHVKHPLSDKYTAELEELGAELRDKIYMLRATDVPTCIKGVGARMSDNTYWIFESEEDEHLYNESRGNPKAHLVQVERPYVKSYKTDIRATFARHGFVPPSTTL